MENFLDRFLAAQAEMYDVALDEIRSGQKQSHWMWFIFPQLQELGFSDTSRYYGIPGIQEACRYLRHPVLGERLREISRQLLQLNENNITKIMGTPDDIKLNSSMTLFACIDESDDTVFKMVIDKFYQGQIDEGTARILSEQKRFS